MMFIHFEYIWKDGIQHGIQHMKDVGIIPTPLCCLASKAFKAYFFFPFLEKETHY